MSARTRGYVGLFLNILVLPGVGSLVAGERVGWIQASLALLALVLLLGSRASGGGFGGAAIGVSVVLVAIWAWGIVTSVRALREA
ncbi:MAG TPA: hypothetical protein VFH78_10400 [Candidatus Thermoplasmatota archaeon]|nr:hypothetical protein [Candidatus Thermoplasmatota archaeon]